MALFDKSSSTDPARPSLTGRLVEDVTDYIDTRISLARLDMQANARNSLVNILHGATLGILALLMLVFGLLFAGLALNAALNSPYWGFGIVFGVLLVLVLIFAFGVDKGAFTALAEKIVHNKFYKSEIEQERPDQSRPDQV